MEFVLYVLGQLGLALLVLLGVVALFYLVVFLFVPRKRLPESMRSDEQQ